MSISARFTSADLARLPAVDGIRYEIIDGDLFVSKQPHAHHTWASDGVVEVLRIWNRENGLGFVVSTPGLVFAEDNDVVPDAVWMSRERYTRSIDAGGHFTLAPELVVEVLSPGSENQRRDRVLKMALYARQGAEEYWIIDWQHEAVEAYRRVADELALVATLAGADVLTTPLLPGLALPVASLWVPTT